jgi:hypothetical protein
MENSMPRILAIIILVGLTGCAITQKVTPISVIPNGEICIVENTKVRPGFLREYEAALQDKGYETRTFADSAAAWDCSFTSTYIARWRWDLALYMAYAEIKLFHRGRPVGEAVYDSLSGGGRLDKFIDAEPKIRELVNELFTPAPHAVRVGERAVRPVPRARPALDPFGRRIRQQPPAEQR